jgi:hypothetical protein
MIKAYVLTAAALVAAGAVTGFLALVSLGIRREEEARTMTLPTADRIARGARVANRLYVRGPGVIHQATLPGRNPPVGGPEVEAVTRWSKGPRAQVAQHDDCTVQAGQAHPDQQCTAIKADADHSQRPSPGGTLPQRLGLLSSSAASGPS